MYIKYLDELRAKGRLSFTIDEVIRDLSVTKASALSAIYRLKKNNVLISPAKGLYIIVPPENRKFGSIPAEELTIILMNHLGIDYYVSLLSAASYYGSSHQKPNKFQLIASKQIKHPLTFGKVKLDVLYKKSLLNLPTQDKTYKSGYLKVASPELVAIDLIRYMDKSGGLNHVATVLSEMIESLSEENILRLTKVISEKYLFQRLGYILEHIETIDEKRKARILLILEDYVKGGVKNYIYLAPELSNKGAKRNKKWKIFENTCIESDL